MGRRGLARGLLVLALGAATWAAEPAPGRAVWHVAPLEATVGDRLFASLVIELPEDVLLETRPLGPSLGPFAVLAERWEGPVAAASGSHWTWSGEIAAYEPGDLEIPALRLGARGAGGALEIPTDAVSVRIASVLEDSTAPATESLADIKAPASIPPDYTALRAALAVLAGLLAAAGVLWQLHRRFAARFAAVPSPTDPFQRVAPDVWVYRELQRLLDRRLPEQGAIDLFYSEIARITKLYATGRFRVELLEHTTAEVPELLRQAGASAQALDMVRALLAECDQVKFAAARPAESEWRNAVEHVYGIVDLTRPADSAARGRGAA